MKNIFVMIVVWVCSCSWASEQLGLELLPSKRPFRLTFADPREIRMALSFQGGSGINASIGNYFSLLGIKPVSDPNWIFHMGLEGAGYFTMRQADNRFPLETADGLIGTYFEGATGPFQGQLRFTHISAHLADGSSGAPIPFSREFINLRVGYVPREEFQFYSGIQFLVNTIPKLDPWGLQLGGNFFLPIESNLVPFLGADLKWRQETPTNPAINILLGLALNNPPQIFRSFRFYYAYFTGADPRGQFYDQIVTTHSVGIDMQI